MKELSKIYGVKIPKPKFNKVYHWTNGVSHWKPGYDTEKVKSRILKPFMDKKIYIAGENYSSYQGWMEGALETSNNVLEKIFKSSSKTKKKKRKLNKKTRKLRN